MKDELIDEANQSAVLDTDAHTPTPWSVVGDECIPGRVLIEVRSNGKKSMIADMGRTLGHGGSPEANGRHIARCVNGYDSLLADLTAVSAHYNALKASHDRLLEALKWINAFVGTAKDGGDAWCAVRNQPGASKWAKDMASAIAQAEALNEGK